MAVNLLVPATVHSHRCHWLLLFSPKADDFILSYHAMEGGRLCWPRNCNKGVHCAAWEL